MANVDSLLDLGDPDESCSAPAAAPQDPPPASFSADPFDPFSMDSSDQGTVQSSSSAFDNFDPFDPFCSPPATDSAEAAQQPLNAAAMSETASPANPPTEDYNAEFADLLGDFSSTNGVTENGDDAMTTVVKETVTTDDGGELLTATTTTTTVTTEDVFNGEGDAAPAMDAEVSEEEEPQSFGDDLVPVSHDPEPEPASYHDLESDPTPALHESSAAAKSQEAAWAGPAEKTEGEADVANEEEVTSVQQEDEGEEAKTEPRFEETLADYQPPKRYVKEERKETAKAPKVMIMEDHDSSSSTSGSTPQPFGSLLGRWKTDRGTDPAMLCKTCGKRVYEMEKIIADKAIYHKSCFKCCHCKSVLSMRNFASLDGEMFCKPHFIELFKSKGNYEEGFGKERKVKQWAAQNEAAAVRAAPLLPKEAPTDVVRAEDETEDDRESMPSIRNLKYQFESQTDGATESSEKASSPVNHSQPAAAKRPSKWDKPKDAPPAPINRKEEEEEEMNGEELPPAAMTRNLVSKFTDIQQNDSSENQRKPVRKMTPPREDIQRGVGEYNQQISRESDVVHSGEHDQGAELPPPEMTKSLLAKFQTLEASSPTKPVPSPSKKSLISVETSNQVRQASRASPDSGISLNQEVDAADGGVYENNPVHIDGVVRSGEEASKEELPEQGFTRNLLAQWRNLEQGSSPQHSAPKPKTSSSQRAPQQQQERVAQLDGHLDDSREVIREADQNEEEYLPPASFTKNMLAHFKSMEAQSPKPSASMPPNQRETEAVMMQQHFKWQVKEAPLLARPGTSAHTQSHDQAPPIRDQEEEDEEPHVIMQEDEVVEGEVTQSSILETQSSIIETELPAPSTTRNLLAKFQSLSESSENIHPSGGEPSYRQRSRSSSRDHLDHISNTREQQPEEYNQNEVFSSNEFLNHDDDVTDANDVTREADRNDEEEMPEEGTTRNLLAKFQSMQMAH